MACGCVTQPALAGQSVPAWQEQWRQLKVQAWSALTDCQRELQNPRAFAATEIEELQSLALRLECERNCKDKELWGGLLKIRKRLTALGRLAHGPLNSTLKGCEHELALYAEQSKQQYEELAAEESALESELTNTAARFEGWFSQAPTPLRSRQVAASTRSTSVGSTARLQRSRSGDLFKQKAQPPGGGLAEVRQRLQEIAAEIEASGGQTGGWSRDDHETFTRLFALHRCKVSPDFIAEAELLMPHIGHEKLIAQVAWQGAHKRRLAERRQLLERWKALRSASQVRCSSEVPGSRRECEDAEEEKRSRQQAREQEQREKEARRREVEEWRQARAQQLKAQEESHRNLLAESRAREEQLRLQRRQEIRGSVEAFRQQKAVAREQEKAAVPSTPTLTAEERKRLAMRNRALLERQHALVKERELRREAATWRFEPPARGGAADIYAHVGSRLHSTTESFVEKARDTLEEEQAGKAAGFAGSKYGVVPGNFAHQGLIRTTRTCPSWRPHYGIY